MHSYFHAAARAASLFFGRFRSIEERVGIIGFTLSLLFALMHSLIAPEFKVGDVELVNPSSREKLQGVLVAAGDATTFNHTSQLRPRCIDETCLIAQPTLPSRFRP